MPLLAGWPAPENRLSCITLKTKQEPFGGDRNAAAFLGQDGAGQIDGSAWKVF